MVCVCVCLYVEHNLKSSQMELGNYQCEGSEAKKKEYQDSKRRGREEGAKGVN